LRGIGAERKDAPMADSPAARAVILEAAINGAARLFQPTIPVREDDIVADALASADAGAAVIHLHAYDADGAPTEDPDVYSRIIERIAARSHAIVYPTLALFGGLEERLAPIDALARRGLIEWGVVDPGSVNIAHRRQAAAGLSGFVYANPDEHIRALLTHAERHGWRPAYAIYEPGFLRLGAALAATFPRLRTPIYRIMFSDGLLFGLPPSPANLAFYARLIDEIAPGAPWMVSGLDADIAPLIGTAVAAGAHLRAGLEDAPFGCSETNARLVARTAREIEAAGGRLASASQARDLLMQIDAALLQTAVAPGGAQTVGQRP
jgi:3-keto-5-aminohexanoate cleavage enzyme